MRPFLIFTLFSILSIYFLTDCANITPPTGGPKDTIPPVLVSAVPENKSVNFSGNSIKLTFDEYLQIVDLRKQLIITPIINQEYETKLRRNTIEIIFPQPFEDSTTYNFNFRKAIQDITEGNVTNDNVFAFSTGSFIDSLTVSGQITSLMDREPLKDITVCLYRASDTLDIFNSQPMYLALTNEEGLYIIENIKNDNYRIYAYNDKNSNLICDNPKEPFGFKENILQLDQEIDSVNIELFNVDLSPLAIQRIGPAGQYYEIRMNKELLEYTIDPVDTLYTLYYNMPETQRAIRFYNTFENLDSLQFYFTATDSILNKLSDTLYLKFEESKRPEADFSCSVKPPDNEPITDHFTGKMKFNKPVKEINTDSIFFKYDSVTFQHLDDSIFLFNERRDEITFAVKLFYTEYLNKLEESDTATDKQNIERSDAPAQRSQRPARSVSKKLNFYLGNGSIISIEDDSLSSNTYSYSRLNPENFGSINGKINSDYSSYFIQLLNSKQEIVDQVVNSETYSFIHIEPGDYIIRVLIDENNNGMWDPGNILENIPPEPVFFLPEKISVRANWELTDVDLEF